jgi:hypothetical protein
LSWKIWKSLHERAREESEKAYKQGLNRSNWNQAHLSFCLAVKLYSKAKDISSANKVQALASFSLAMQNPNEENWCKTASSMNLLGNIALNIVRNVKADEICKECSLKALEEKLRRENQPSEKISIFEEMIKNYNELNDTQLLVPFLLERKKILARIRAEEVLLEMSRFKEQLQLSNRRTIESWRKHCIQKDNNGLIKFPCGCFYKEFALGLVRVTDKECCFHDTSSNTFIVRKPTTRMTFYGRMEPDHIRVVHEVVETTRKANIKEISELTGLTSEIVFQSLMWLIKEGEIEDLIKEENKKLIKSLEEKKKEFAGSQFQLPCGCVYSLDNFGFVLTSDANCPFCQSRFHDSERELLSFKHKLVANKDIERKTFELAKEESEINREELLQRISLAWTKRNTNSSYKSPVRKKSPTIRKIEDTQVNLRAPSSLSEQGSPLWDEEKNGFRCYFCEARYHYKKIPDDKELREKCKRIHCQNLKQEIKKELIVPTLKEALQLKEQSSKIDVEQLKKGVRVFGKKAG